MEQTLTALPPCAPLAWEPGGLGPNPDRGPPHLPLVREGRPLLLSGTLCQGSAQPVSQGIGVLRTPHAGSPPQPRWALWRLFPQGAEAPSSLIAPPRSRSLDSPAVCRAGGLGEPISCTVGRQEEEKHEPARAGRMRSAGTAAARGNVPAPSPAPSRAPPAPPSLALSRESQSGARPGSAAPRGCGGTRSRRGCAGRERRVPAAAAGRYRGAGRAGRQRDRPWGRRAGVGMRGWPSDSGPPTFWLR